MEHTFMCAMHACRVAICGMLSPDCSPLSKEYSLISNTTDSPAKAPLKKVLTKNRYYLETGVIAYDDAVLQYMQKLEDHRKKCEVSCCGCSQMHACHTQGQQAFGCTPICMYACTCTNGLSAQALPVAALTACRVQARALETGPGLLPQI